MGGRWSLFRGVTPKLIAAAAVASFVSVALTGVLASLRHHAQLLDHEEASIRHSCETHYADLGPEIQRVLGAPAPARDRAMQVIYANLRGLLPQVSHFSVIRPLPDGTLVAALGDGLGPLAPATQRELEARSPVFHRVRATGRVSVVYHAPLARSWRDRTPVAILRIGTTAPGFTRFLTARLLRDAPWIGAVFLVAVAVNALMIGWLTRSLRSVADYARAIERGDLGAGISVASTDEANTIAQAFNSVTDRLRQSYVSTLGALAALLESKDRTTETHSLRGVQYALELGRAAGLSKQELIDLEYGALLHDIGKVGIADVILKKTGPLTEEEWTVMRQHPVIGYNVLKSLDFLRNALPVVLHHQERYDGRGYPNGLKGEEIPLFARIFCIADSFDAMISDRPYRRAMRPEKAVDEMRRNGGHQFDPHLVEIFARLWQEGRLASVTAGGRVESLQPKLS